MSVGDGRVGVLLAVTGRPYESLVLAALDRRDSPLSVARRCLDLADLLAVAAVPARAASVAVVSSRLHRLDAHAMASLAAAGVRVVVVRELDDDRAERPGGDWTVDAPDGDGSAFVAALTAAVLGLPPAAVPVAAPEPHTPGGLLVAVWGPCGAPGRTTVATTVADELARAGVRAMLVDADTYGPSVAQRLGLLDEASGVAAAVRLSDAGTDLASALHATARTIDSGLSVLTGLTRADRWPELSGSALRRVWQAARVVADVTVVDCGFCLEEDDELSYDSVVARRNAATLVTLGEADVLVAVGAADVVGLARLVRALHELADLAERRPGAVPERRRVLVNRSPVVGRRAARRLRAAAGWDVDGGLADALVVPDDPASLAWSVERGRTLAEVAPRSPARAALRRLADELAAEDARSPAATARSGPAT